MSKLPKIISPSLKKVLSSQTNENYLHLYVTHIVKSVISIHNLLNNRIEAIEMNKETKKVVEEEKN